MARRARKSHFPLPPEDASGYTPQVLHEEKAMHKTEMIALVAEQTDMSRDKADAAVSAIIEHITNALSRGETVTLVGFGSFVKTHRAARHGRHPKTGASIAIAASSSVLFKPGKALKDAVNQD
jgi:nucleoid DNA-binding protein